MTDPITDKITSRGLSDGFGTPLRRFKGKFHSYAGREDTKFNRIRVDLNFTDIDVIESTEPYNFPTATITINFSEKKNSIWGVFSNSLNKFLKEGEDIKDAVGKNMELALTEGHDFGKNRQTNEPMIRDAWEVVGMEGAGPAIDPEEQALKLLNGKTATEFGQVVFADPIVKQKPELLSSILDNAFIPAMLEAGKITKDDKDIYHLKEA